MSEHSQRLVNLTPHDIRLIGTDGSERLLAAAATPALIEHTVVPCDADALEYGIPVVDTLGGSLTGLPDPRPNALYVVSAVVAEAARSRTDLVVPDDLVRNEDGIVTGAARLRRVQRVLDDEPSSSPSRQRARDSAISDANPSPSAEGPSSTWRHTLLYTIKNSWRALTIGMLVAAALAWLIDRYPTVGYAEAAIALVTLLSVWMFEKRRQWLESLETRLTVHFWYSDGDRWILWATWEDAYLSAESNIRETAQQLGRQLNNGDILSLSGYLWVEDHAPKPIEKGDDVFRRYVAHLPLANRPALDDPSVNTSLVESRGKLTSLNEARVKEFRDTVRS